MSRNSILDINSAEFAAVFHEATYWASRFGDLLLRHVPLGVGWKLLDVGTGAGFPLLELAQRLGPSSYCVGVDTWEAGLNQARDAIQRRGLSNADVIWADAEGLPFPDSTFHLITANLVYNNLANREAVLRSCRRVCRPEGRLALTTNTVGHMAEVYEAYAAVLSSAGTPEELKALQKQESHRGEETGICDLLSACGWKVVRTEREAHTWRYSNADALMTSYFVRRAFESGWKDVVGQVRWPEIRNRICALLDEQRKNELIISVPALYVEAVRV